MAGPVFGGQTGFMKACRFLDLRATDPLKGASLHSIGFQVSIKLPLCVYATPH